MPPLGESGGKSCRNGRERECQTVAKTGCTPKWRLPYLPFWSRICVGKSPQNSSANFRVMISPLTVRTAR